MFRSLILAGSVALLTACGGGGGGSGGGVPGGPTPTNEYEIFLTAERVTLPLNIENVRPGLDGYSGGGRGAVYTTLLTVSARRKNTGDAIPSGEDVFGCTMTSGLESGALMYLNGDPETEVEVDIVQRNPVTGDLEVVTVSVPGFFRSISLDSNSGAATFHFHAFDKIGNATIRCSVTDPQSGVSKTKDIQINVGGTSSGRAAMVQLTRQALNYLYMQGLNGPTQMVLQATILDEAGQPVPDAANNLCARIVPNAGSTAEDAARLFTGSQNVGAGAWVRSSSIDSEARFSLNSGSSIGPIAVEVRANRDGNAANCDGFDISNVAVIPVVSNNPFDPLGISAPPATELYVGEPLVTAVAVSGGTPPYTWLLTGGALPPGVSFGSDGAFIGTPTTAGSYTFTVRAEDSAFVNRSQLSQTYTMNVYLPLSIATTSLPNATCSGTPPGTPNFYSFTLSATGGRTPLTWTVTGLPANLAQAGAGSPDIAGLPACAAGTASVTVTVTDANGRTATRIMPLTTVVP